MWRNRYTRTFEGRVEKSLGVQVPPSTIKKGITYVIPFLIYLSGEGFNTFIDGSADFRTDAVWGETEPSPVSENFEPSKPEV